MAAKIIYTEGQKIGECIFLADAENGKRGERRASFRCHCGKTFIGYLHQIKGGYHKGCGCSSANKSGNYKKHGLSTNGYYRSEYNIWRGIISRCYNHNNCNYKNYGARGIKVCDRWKENVTNFIDDMGYKPSPKLTVERIDKNGNYEPSNCIWATNLVQQRNRRNNVVVSFNGENLCLSELSDKYWIQRYLLASRIIKYNWDVEKAITTPVGNHKRTKN